MASQYDIAVSALCPQDWVDKRMIVYTAPKEPGKAIAPNMVVALAACGRGGSVCLNRLAARISVLPLVDHAAARSGWSKYSWSGVRPPSAECGLTAL